MRYQYNYSFFEEWLKANEKMKDKVLQDVLGIKANSGIEKWILKTRPMPIVSILRFCNSFDIPLSAFIKEGSGEDWAIVAGHPRVNDQLEPNGGYLPVGAKRKRGEHTLLDPVEVNSYSCTMPESFSLEEHKNFFEVPKATDTIDSASLIALENKHADQRERLLEIISEQQKTITELTEKIKRMEEEFPKFGVVRQYAPKTYHEDDISYPAMVAEDLPTKN